MTYENLAKIIVAAAIGGVIGFDMFCIAYLIKTGIEFIKKKWRKNK